jgi:probable phosphoglycerate mutase
MIDRVVVLVRHGETEWSRTGQHTGRTDIPLTDAGRDAARALGPRLAGVLSDVHQAPRFGRVLTSPLVRASETCALAGYGDRVEKSDALVEWHYGDYEGKKSAEIRAMVPGWTVFTHGCPNGERAEDVGRRVDPLVCELAASNESTLVFAHGHLLRIFAMRWLGLAPETARCFMLDTAHVSILGNERETQVIRRWNT